MVLNGIFWVLRTGAPWRDLPERYGKWKTCHDRLLRWRRRGVWERVLQALQGEAEAVGEVAWNVVSVDGSVVRAHQHAAGARHAPAQAEAPAFAEKRGKWRMTVRPSAGAGAGSPPSCTWPPMGRVGRWRCG